MMIAATTIPLVITSATGPSNGRPPILRALIGTAVVRRTLIHSMPTKRLMPLGGFGPTWPAGTKIFHHCPSRLSKKPLSSIPILVRSTFFVEGFSDQSLRNFQIINVYGQSVQFETTSLTARNLLKISGLKSGVYGVKASAGGHDFTQKLVVR